MIIRFDICEMNFKLIVKLATILNKLRPELVEE